jgi:hypothetical protein
MKNAQLVLALGLAFSFMACILYQMWRLDRFFSYIEKKYSRYYQKLGRPKYITLSPNRQWHANIFWSNILKESAPSGFPKDRKAQDYFVRTSKTTRTEVVIALMIWITSMVKRVKVKRVKRTVEGSRERFSRKK